MPRDPRHVCSKSAAESQHDWEVCADFADFIFDGKRPANRSLFNTTAYPIQRPYSWTAPPPPPTRFEQ